MATNQNISSTRVTEDSARTLAHIAIFELDRLLGELANMPETDDPLDIYKVRGIAARCQQMSKIASDVLDNEPSEAMLADAEETLHG